MTPAAAAAANARVIDLLIEDRVPSFVRGTPARRHSHHFPASQHK
jgi:hypothetical protein